MGVECDGQPYVLGIRLLRVNLVCEMCNAFLKKDQKTKHTQEYHPWAAEGDVNFVPEFEWLILMPGPGHIEINMVKATVKFTWAIFWESLAELFNFKSPKAKQVAFNHR